MQKKETLLLKNNLIFDINIHITYSIKDDKFVPIEGNSTITSFIMGYE